MTPRQASLFRFIRDTIAERGEAPTYPEMMEAVGARSTSQVNHLVTMLVERGHIIRIAGMKRGLRLPPQPQTPKGAVAFRMEDDELVERYRLTEAGWSEV